MINDFMVVNNPYGLNGSTFGFIDMKFQGDNLVLVKLGHKRSALFVEGEKTIQRP